MAPLPNAEYGTFEVSDKTKETLHLPSTGSSPAPTISNRLDFLITPVLFIAWWVLASRYNIDNKLAVMATPAPLTIATLQCYVGCLWFIPLWLSGLRPMPTFHSWNIFLTKMVPQGIFHGMAHWGGVASMGAGAVSFTQIIKACEPVTTSILTIFVLRYVFSVWTNLTLIPIVGGVSFASFGSTEFGWYAFVMAMISNVGASLRGVYAKKTMADPKQIGTNLDSANIFSILTLIFSVAFTPLFFIFEGLAIYSKWGAGAHLFDQPPSNFTIIKWIVLSGVWHYAYNEVSFRALGRVNQLTHAVGNTLKRVFTIAYAVVVFHEPVGVRGMIGCAIAILGTFLFSLAKWKFG